MNAKLYAFARGFTKTVLRVIFPYRIVGRENIPDEGGVIICSNHLTMIDPFVIASASRRPMSFMAKKELFKNRFLAKVLTGMGAFPVARGESDLAAIRTSLSVVRSGGILGIFPEGTRAHKGKKTEWLEGTALIALRANVPILPVNISRPFRPLRMTQVTFGPGIEFMPEERRPDRENLARVTEKIRAASDVLRP